MFLRCLNFCPTSRETRASRDGDSDFWSFFVFCGHKLLRACLKGPALTGYVGDAQDKGCISNLGLIVFRQFPSIEEFERDPCCLVVIPRQELRGPLP